MKAIDIFWFRRDLRLEDNVGFAAALSTGRKILPIFIFDKNILEELQEDDARLTFIHDNVMAMNTSLEKAGTSGFAIYHDTPADVFEQLLSAHNIHTVHTNRDYEPYAKERDPAIELICRQHETAFVTYKDQVIFEKDEVVKNDGGPYVVYTPYKKKWLSQFTEDLLEPHRSEDHLGNCVENMDLPKLSLEDLGFVRTDIDIPDAILDRDTINSYGEQRNLPAIDATTRIGHHLRFGTISPREAVRLSLEHDSEVYQSELIWREFFMQVMYHYPHTMDKSFKAKYDNIEWRNNEEEFERWKTGTTGYGLVDAGMRQLNKSGFMHNRVRMLVASFLVKHLMIDWRWGESYFAEKLLDYEASSNVGNWQWVAGSGVDASPYFRIFNPITQVKKFDKQEEYIKKWVPEYGTEDYPEMMVDHKESRERALRVYKAAVS